MHSIQLQQGKIEKYIFVADFEKDILQKAKDKYGSTREIGKYLHIDQSTVVRKMKKYGI